MTDNSTYRAMKRVGTFKNYIRITSANEYLLKDTRMVEVNITVTDGVAVEDGTSNRDFLSSKTLAPVISEIINLNAKREVLIAHVAGLVGGKAALQQAGVELPDQNIHNTPAGRTQANNDKQAAKAKVVSDKKREVRTAQVNAATKKRAKTRPTLPKTEAPVKHVTDKVVPVQNSDEDI